MKARTTRKFVKGLRPYAIWYCELQNILDRYFSPIYYTAWTYGRDQDTYLIDGVYFSTWYSPIGERLDYNKVKEADKKAWNLGGSREQRKEQAKAILLDLIK